MLSLRRNVDGHATRVAFDKTFVTDVTIFVIHKLLTLAIILRFLPFQRKFIVFIVPLCPVSRRLWKHAGLSAAFIEACEMCFVDARSSTRHWSNVRGFSELRSSRTKRVQLTREITLSGARTATATALLPSTEREWNCSFWIRFVFLVTRLRECMSGLARGRISLLHCPHSTFPTGTD